MRAVAIVDTRNVVGQGQDVLGLKLQPTSEGVANALARYGLNLVEAHFAVALPRDRDRYRLRAKEAYNLEYIRRLEMDSRSRILRAELHQRNGTTKEKMADVLCAIETVRQAKQIAESSQQSAAEVVVLVSMDLDLKPGVDLALEFGVPVLAASAGGLAQRGHPFIALSEPALADVLGARPPFGHRVRDSVAQMLHAPTATEWTVLHPFGPQGAPRQMMLRHPTGALGVAPIVDLPGAQTGSTHELSPTGLADTRNHFPRIALGRTPRRDDALVEGVALKRHALLGVEVGYEGTTRRVYAPDGHLTPGTRVLLHRQDRRVRLVGCLHQPRPLIACGGVEMAPSEELLAKVYSHTGRNALAATSGGLKVFVPGGAEKTDINGLYAVSLAGTGRDGDAAFVGFLASSRLGA